jgi:hypothetical protein
MSARRAHKALINSKLIQTHLEISGRLWALKTDYLENN